MSRRLVLAVEIPDDVGLRDLASAIRESFERAYAPGVNAEDGRVRLPWISQAVGGWTIKDVDDSVGVQVPWTTRALVDTVDAIRLPDGSVQVVSAGGADPSDEEAVPDECFADVVLPAEQAKTIGLALAAWALR